MESTRQWSCSVMLQEKTQGTVFLGRDYVLDMEELLRDKLLEAVEDKE